MALVLGYSYISLSFHMEGSLPLYHDVGLSRFLALWVGGRGW